MNIVIVTFQILGVEKLATTTIVSLHTNVRIKRNNRTSVSLVQYHIANIEKN